jgi:hypothetical protein
LIVRAAQRRERLRAASPALVLAAARLEPSLELTSSLACLGCAQQARAAAAQLATDRRTNMKRILRLLLFAFVVLVLWLLLIWPTLDAFVIRREVHSALQRATSVRLQEYAGLAVLTAVVLPRSEWHRVAAALPVVPDAGLPAIIRKCFWPHHRVIIVDERGAELILRVCFTCEEIATGSSGVHGTPYLWRSSLRRLFTEQKIPIRDEHEYSKLQELAYQSGLR